MIKLKTLFYAFLLTTLNVFCYTVPFSTTWTGTHAFPNEDVIIPNGVTLTLLTASVQMGTGKKIIVEDGGAIIARRTYFIPHSSAVTWAGIELEDTYYTNNLQPAIQASDGTTIAKADIGVSTGNSYTGNLKARKLVFDNCRFAENGRHLNLSYHANNTNYTNNEIEFRRTTFQGETGLSTGIRFDFTKSLTIERCDFISYFNPVSSSAPAKTMFIQGGKDIKIVGNVFRGKVNRNIETLYSTVSNMVIEDNEFIVPIDLGQAGNINDAGSKNTAIFIQQIGSNPFGLFTKIEGSSISNNTFKTEDPASTYFCTGIYMNGAQIVGTGINRNDFVNIKRGILMTDMVSDNHFNLSNNDFDDYTFGIIAYGVVNGVKITCNTFYDGSTAITSAGAGLANQNVYDHKNRFLGSTLDINSTGTPNFLYAASYPSSINVNGTVTLQSPTASYVIVCPWEGSSSKMASEELNVEPEAFLSDYVLSVSNMNADNDIRIYNTLGKCVYTNKTREPQLDIDVAHFNSGMYIIHISNKQYHASHKFVIE